MPPRGAGERAGRVLFLGFCSAVLLFLIAPILVVVPLSFNAEPYEALAKFGEAGGFLEERTDGG